MARIKKLTSLLLALWMTVTAMQLPALANDTVPEETAEAEISMEEPDGNADTEAVTQSDKLDGFVWKEEHKDYICKAIAWHAENSEKVQEALTSGKNAVFFFDGTNINLNGAEITQSGYIKNGNRYNRSAVCVVVKQNDNQTPEIVFVSSASTMADNVRGTNSAGGRPIVIDGIYTLITVNHKGLTTPAYAGHTFKDLIVVRCTGNSSTLLSINDGKYNNSGINLHARQGDTISSSSAESTGCLIVGRPVGNSQNYNNFMNAMGFDGQVFHGGDTKDASSWSTFPSENSESYSGVLKDKENGVAIIDHYWYKESLATIYGDDNDHTGEQIADLITENSVKWYDAMNATAEYTLSGVIRNATEGSVDRGKEVEGVTVTRKTADGTVIDSTTTDANGTFSFTFTGEKGDYIFMFSKTGFQTKETAVITIYQSSPSLGAFVIYEEEGEVIASGTCGDNLTWVLNADGVFTVTGTGSMSDDYLNSSGKDSPWYQYREQIKTIVLSDGVTATGYYVFAGCVNLTKVVFPQNSLKKLAGGTFVHCSSLEEIVIPDSVTSISWDVLYDCTSLKNVTLPCGLTKIQSSMFYNCQSLTSIQIPATITDILWDAFRKCSTLTKVYFYGNAPTIDSKAFDETPSDLVLYYVEGKSGWTSPTWNGYNTAIFSTGTVDPTEPDVYTLSGVIRNATEGSVNYGKEVEGVTVTRKAADGTVIDSTTSNAEGNFSFTFTGEKGDYIFVLSKAGFQTFTTAAMTIHQTSPSLGAFVIYEEETEAEIIASGTCGDNLTWTLDDAGTLTISGEGAMTNYNSGNAPWYGKRAQIKKVVFEGRLSTIGSYAFYECSLTSVSIPDSVYYISSDAFSGCSSLTSVSIPDSVMTIENDAFEDCSSLTSVSIPNRVHDISAGTFSGCSSLTTVFIPDSVTSIGNYAFKDCSNLTTISIPNRVTSIGYSAFHGCTSLTSVSIPDSVTSIGDGSFLGCSSLTSISIPDGVTSIRNSTFYNCSSLTTVSIPDSITSIEYSAFRGCTSLTSVSIPDSVTILGESAFEDCSSLTSISIPNGVTSTGYSTFCGCTSLTSISIPNGVTSIGGGSFSGCSSLTTISIPDSVTSIEAYAFSSCSNLTAISIPNTVTRLGSGAFKDCSSLTSISIPYNITSIEDYTFYKCNNLATISIPDGVTSIGKGALSSCSSLTTVSIPDSVSIIGIGAFQDCSSLNTVSIPDSIISLPSQCFFNCTSLTSVYFHGDAPTLNTNAFLNTPSSLVLYYISGKSGWTSPTWTDSNGVTYNTATFTPGAVDPKPTIPGDISGDGVLDYFDVTALYAAYQSGEVDAEVMDVNHDGVVDYYDVSKLYAAFRGTATLT